MQRIPMTECILCHSVNFKKQFGVIDQYKDQFEFCVCFSCGANFLNPLPSQDQLKRAYANDYYGEGTKKFSPAVERVLNYFRSQKAAAFSKYLNNGDKILDVGCADGEFLHQLSKFGNYELHGLELEGKAFERAKQRTELILHGGVLEKETYPQENFQFISLVHVFEHLPNPGETIACLSEIIKSKGFLYIEQPNINSWQAKLFKDKWLHLDPPRHLNFLPEETFITKMEEYGFQLVTKKYFSPQFSPFGFQQSLLNLICKKREVLYEHLKGNQQYTKDYSSANLYLQKLFHWTTFPIFVFTDAIASFFKKGATIRMIFQKIE